MTLRMKAKWSCCLFRYEAVDDWFAKASKDQIDR